MSIIENIKRAKLRDMLIRITALFNKRSNEVELPLDKQVHSYARLSFSSFERGDYFEYDIMVMGDSMGDSVFHMSSDNNWHNIQEEEVISTVKHMVTELMNSLLRLVEADMDT